MEVTEKKRYCIKCDVELVLGENWSKIRKNQHYYLCNSCFNAKIREYNRKLKKQVLDHYGGVCHCCGEFRIELLAIDHINGGGNQHRKANGIDSGTDTYHWLRKNNYPFGFRVLCHNCNQAFGLFGYCPHQQEKKAMQPRYIPIYAGMMSMVRV